MVRFCGYLATICILRNVFQPLAINFSHRPKAQFLDGLCIYYKLNQLQDNDYIKLESISNNIEVF